MSDCTNKGKFFIGCKFEPRYHTTEPSIALIDLLERQWQVSEIDKERLVIHAEYIHDVCIRCGKIIKTNEPS